MLKDDRIWERVEKALTVSHRTLLYGPPGTGKTTIGFAGGANPLIISLHDETTVAELIGHFVPVGDRFIWLDGPGLAAWRQGRRLILDEIDLASGGVLSVCRGLLNDPSTAAMSIPDKSMAGMSEEAIAELILSGGGLETVTPAPGFSCLATMNGVPEDLDEPLLERFDAKYEIKSPHPDAVRALPEDLRGAARKTVALTGPRRIGIRPWKAFAHLRDHLGEEAAAEAVFGPRAGDVMDGLRLARPSGPPERGVTLEAVGGPVTIPADAKVTRFVEETSTPRADWPTVYFVKTGAKGRPPLVKCETHGKMTHKSATERSGEIVCNSCSRVAAPSGKWHARVLNPSTEKWEARD